MEDKIVQLSDLRRGGPNIPVVDPTTLTRSPDRLDGVINNRFIEDRVVNSTEFDNRPDLQATIAAIQDEGNRFSQIQTQIKRNDELIAGQVAGRGITQLGQTARSVTDSRRLNQELDLSASRIERLRGNESSARELERQARANAVAAGSSANQLQEFGSGEQTEVEQVLAQEAQTASQQSEFNANEFLKIRGVVDYSKGFSDLTLTEFTELPIEEQTSLLSKERRKQIRKDQRAQRGIETNINTSAITGGAVTGSAGPFLFNTSPNNLDNLL